MPYKNDVFSEPDNEDRGFWALCGVEAYAGETRFDEREQVIDGAKIEAGDTAEKEHAEELISDLLGDLRHLCDQFGIDWDAMDNRGADHYLEEKEDAEVESFRAEIDGQALPIRMDGESGVENG